MFVNILTRRGALVALIGVGAAALAACNAPQPTAIQPHPGALKVKIARINVDTSGLLAQSGDPTASWVQSTLPGLLAQSFAPYMAPGDPNGATLNVQIASISLGTVGGAAGAIDWMKGSATLSGGGATTTTVKLNATTTYISSPVDDTLWQQALQGRVQALSQSFAYWLPRKFNL